MKDSIKGINSYREIRKMLDIIRSSLWKIEPTVADESVFQEFRNHAIVALPAKILPSISMQKELYQRWEDDIIRQIAYYGNYIYMQSTLPISVRYVILKGTSAAKYYPCPEYRAMGDIDIITERNDYITACQQLLSNGFHEITSKYDFERGRHRTFIKNRVCVEVHAFFASMNDPEKAKYFDDLLINNINDSHVLPDIINGLVLIEHINQHMEEGLGLRQIIDWMLFVDRCLDIDDWKEFKYYAERVGLATLAITVTRMCEMYLGLKEHNWCAAADEKLCSDLMDYVLKCGNFGNKITENQKISIGRVYEFKHPMHMLKTLQSKGQENWKAAKNPLFKPFAWIWQGVQYAKNSHEFIISYSEADRLDTMFDALGVKRNKNGLVYYENGKYYKRNL